MIQKQPVKVASEGHKRIGDCASALPSTYLFACKHVSAQLDLAKGALSQRLAKNVVPNGVGVRCRRLHLMVP